MVYLYYNKVEISGVNTSQLKVLRESEKMELLKKVKQGDMRHVRSLSMEISGWF